MTTTHEFSGAVLSPLLCELGEGPSFEAATGTLWWFDIVGKILHELELATNHHTSHALPFMASVVARIDAERQLIASEKGLFIRDRATGELSLHCELEPDKPGNRSNDGRVHPSGSLWIGTMSKTGEAAAGAIYHVAKGAVTPLFREVGIPNSICFSPDGATGYFVDTKVNRMMRVALDPATGLPQGEAEVFVDQAGQPGGIDGSICDSEGKIWNARWGQGAVDCYSPTGEHLARYRLPAKQTTCPVFIGEGRIAVTSAREGLDEAARAADPLAGVVFSLSVPIRGQDEPHYML
ncbi:SMP-30/gluconolactonase/LRE family protein [Neorhizobium lilium]|uniref:SMP-30/gluconolactonase/LRE family protein n=1 Tax=Neorhizobium lilium TaxID=2503024 RepID=A0A444LG37_9HYPH|nr:SMP-30/gluconolactonase/LRE family protein [Neorhizobium lilium]RWX77144.1 SMP-30/gluconolactonase/LRE family protein [Neorhizobium lilium]